MSASVVRLDVSLPTKEERRRCAAYSSRKPMAGVDVVLDSGAVRSIVVPVRAARLLDPDDLGLPIPEDEAFERIHEVEYRACFQAVTDALSRRDHASGELRDKLKRYGYREQEIDRALSCAQEHRYLDDARFTVYFIEERIRRGWGRRKIESELFRRGVRTDDIEGYPDRFFSEEADLERATQLLAKRACPPAHPKEKFIRFLVSRGYSYSIALQAAQARILDEDDSGERVG